MFSIKISIPIMDPLVSFIFAMIRDDRNLRLPLPNFPSTVLRSPVSFNSYAAAFDLRKFGTIMPEFVGKWSDH